MNQVRGHETIDENSVDVAALRRTPARTRPKRRYRGLVIGGLVAVVLALFVSVVWFAYQDMMPGGDEAPPVVRAEVGPLKREPNERGGAPVVNEESVVVQALNEPDAPVRVERLIPRDESAPRSAADVIPDELQAEPVPPETAEDDSLDALLADLAEGPKELREIEPGDGGAVASVPEEQQIPLVPAAPPVPAADPVAPQPVAEAPRPIEEPTPSAPAPPAPEASAPTVAASAPEPTAATRAPAPRTAPAPAAAPARTATTTPARPAAPPTPRTQVAAAPAASGELTASYRLQLLAVRDEAAAAAAWSDLQRQHPSVLGGLRSRVEQANVGGNTFFRLQAGPFQGRDAADRACRVLQQAGSDCFIVGPTS
ncbi:MAG: SPOR domain-containing protein [Geminicoccaceae bacterium]|jgi:cell division protein FtsN|nr:SPOR domain-containing protein [Geminicoccaceae bacterium]MCB9969340.1 SPOR domain-containing protein [Geminicoccaceae bacterium]